MAKQTRDEYQAVTNYVDQLAQEGILHRSLYKAGITQKMIVDDMVKELAHHQIDVTYDQIQAGGLYGENIKTYHEGHKKWEKNKGWALIHADGVPVLECQNYTQGHDKTVIKYDVEECLSRNIIAHGSVNEKGWRNYDSLPGSFIDNSANAFDSTQSGPSIDSEEFKAAQAQRMEESRRQQAIKEAQREQEREQGTQQAQERWQKALNSNTNANSRQPDGENIPTHANHAYLQGKFKGHIDDYSQYLQDWAVDSIHYLSSSDEVFPLLVASRDLDTGEVKGLQRIMADKERIEADQSASGKVEYISKLKEDGSAKLVKKFQQNTGPIDSYARVFNDPSSDKELYLVGEGPLSTVVAADLFEISSMANVDKACALSAFTAGNMVPTVAAIREKSPDAIIIISADDDFKNGPEKNAGRNSALRAAEESNAVVVFPPREYLKPNQSDWDDVNSNIYEVLAGKYGTEPSYEEVHNITSSIFKQELAKSMNDYNLKQEELLTAAEAMVQSAQPQPQPQPQPQSTNQAASDEISPADAIMLASQNAEFKKLTINALKTVSVMSESQHWENTVPLVTMLESAELNDGSLENMEPKLKKSVMRQASGHLGEMLTENKKYDSEGNDNLSTMQLVSQKGWDVSPNYATSFTSNLAGNLQEGQQSAKMAEPEYLNQMLHKAVAVYQSQSQANTVKTEPAPQPQAAPAPQQKVKEQANQQGVPVTHQGAQVTHQGKPVVHQESKPVQEPVQQQQANQQGAQVTHQGAQVTHQGNPVVHQESKPVQEPVQQQQANQQGVPVTHQGAQVTHQGNPVVHQESKPVQEPVQQQQANQQGAQVTHQGAQVTHQGNPVVHQESKPVQEPVQQQQANQQGVPVTHQGAQVTHQGKPVVHQEPVKEPLSQKEVFANELRATYGLMGGDVDTIADNFDLEDFKDNLVGLKERYKVKDVHAVQMILDMANDKQKKAQKELQQHELGHTAQKPPEAALTQQSTPNATISHTGQSEAPRTSTARRKI